MTASRCLSFNDVHRTLNKWCREGHITNEHLIPIVREIVALSPPADTLPSEHPMSDSKIIDGGHTPGPWKLLAVGDEGRLCPADKNNQSILTIEEGNGTLFACVYEEDDARLIAAAPDLLEVAKATLPFLIEIAKQRHPKFEPEMADEDSTIGKALKAIAKAEGRS